MDDFFRQGAGYYMKEEVQTGVARMQVGEGTVLCEAKAGIHGGCCGGALIDKATARHGFNGRFRGLGDGELCED